MKNRLGTFYASCHVENHVDRKKSAEVPKLLVDSGAEFTWINAETLKNIGVKREKKDYTFVMANGQHITRAVGFAIIRVGDAVTTDEVVFGEPGDLQILGARSLEGMNLRVDSRAKKLVAGGPILAAAQKVVKAVEKKIKPRTTPTTRRDFNAKTPGRKEAPTENDYFVTTTKLIPRLRHQFFAASCLRIVSGFWRNCPPLISCNSFLPSTRSSKKSGW